MKCSMYNNPLLYGRGNLVGGMWCFALYLKALLPYTVNGSIRMDINYFSDLRVLRYLLGKG
jgi:hypothetical protein